MTADYDMPSAVEKRVRFFDGQYLQDQDFIDEQKYHLDRERRHLRLLHGPGIAEGLAVAAGPANQVIVAPGTAVDSDGRLLVLANSTTVDLPAKGFNGRQGVELYPPTRRTRTTSRPRSAATTTPAGSNARCWPRSRQASPT
jgi:hypothetical protein